MVNVSQLQVLMILMEIDYENLIQSIVAMGMVTIVLFQEYLTKSHCFRLEYFQFEFAAS